jgi:hypothetical protein
MHTIKTHTCLVSKQNSEPVPGEKPFGVIDTDNNTFRRVVSSTHESFNRCISVACRWAADTMEKFDIPVPEILKTFSTL